VRQQSGLLRVSHVAFIIWVAQRCVGHIVLKQELRGNTVAISFLFIQSSRKKAGAAVSKNQEPPLTPQGDLFLLDEATLREAPGGLSLTTSDEPRL
jgi:hypothetical protein